MAVVWCGGNVPLLDTLTMKEVSELSECQIKEYTLHTNVCGRAVKRKPVFNKSNNRFMALFHLDVCVFFWSEHAKL